MLHDAASNIELQDRDLTLLLALLGCRVMTLAHIATLYFDGRYEYAKKRLQKLKSEGLLAERPRTQFEPSVLFLTRPGLTLLKAHGLLDLYPSFDLSNLVRRARVSDMTLRHELAVLDLKVAFYTSARLRNITFLEFNTWPRLNQFKVLGDIVKPDAFVRLRETLHDGRTQEHSFYLELDRSTESPTILCAKARAYAAYHRSAYSSHRYNPLDEHHSAHSFRVLFVLLSAERRDNLARRLLRVTPPILSLAWLATFADAIADPFSPIWLRPVDLRNGHSALEYSLYTRAKSDQ